MSVVQHRCSGLVKILSLEEIVKMKCPFCGSGNGYYMYEKVQRALMFSFEDSEPIGASEDMTEYSGKRRYCMDCHKILPRKLFEKIN